VPRPESPEDRRLKDGCRNKEVRSAKIRSRGGLSEERAARAVNRRTGSYDGPVPNVSQHRRPCGQPAVVGGIGCFRPVPLQAGHFKRINATPSDLPFKSTGFAT